jgi:hypothetical protein
MSTQERPDTRYDRMALVRAYLHARAEPADGIGGYRLDDEDGYNEALRAHHRTVLAGLEELFHLRLNSAALEDFNDKVFFMLFSSTAASFLSVRTPWSGFLEAGLLLQRLEKAGETGERVDRASHRIERLRDDLREAHLEILDALVACFLRERAHLTFTSADLRALGVDDNPPDHRDRSGE